MCAQIGAGCPATGSGINADNQLSITGNSTKKLDVENKNQDPPRQIGYILCFVDGKTGNPLPAFDPVMDNRGGG
jgi:hypothetical protein